MITLSIMLATIMQTLDSTIANVALPHMQGTMSASQDQIAWVLTAYIVAAAIATPLTGWLVDRFGQKNIFMTSIAGFTVASMLCGMSNSLAQIVAARLLQGVFGAALVPLAQVVLLDINPREKQGPAMAVWGMGVMVGPILGPTLGGWLTDSYSWRWVFFINVPIGLLAFYGMWKYIRPVPGAKRMRFDVFGFATLSLSIGALQLLLDRGQQNDWFSSTETWIEAIALLVTATYFVAHSLMTPAHKSFVDFRLFKNRNYISGTLFIFIVGLVLYATRALIPTMLETLLDYPVATTGLVTAPSGLGTMLAMLVVGRIVGKVDLRLTLFVGFMISAFSLWQMAHYSLSLSPGDIIWPGVIQGIGMGLVFVPLERGDLRHLESANARTGHRPVQPGAQYRQQHRHLLGANHAGAQYRHRPRVLDRTPHRPEPGMAQPRHCGQLRPEHARGRRLSRQRRHATGRHARVHRRLLADAVPHRRRHAAAAAHQGACQARGA